MKTQPSSHCFKPWQHCDYSSLLVQLTHTRERSLNSKPTVCSIRGCLKPSQLITVAVTLRTCHCECCLWMGENTPTLKPSQKSFHLTIIFSGWFRLCVRSEPTSARTDIFSRLIAVIWWHRSSNGIILAVANQSGNHWENHFLPACCSARWERCHLNWDCCTKVLWIWSSASLISLLISDLSPLPVYCHFLILPHIYLFFLLFSFVPLLSHLPLCLPLSL